MKSITIAVLSWLAQAMGAGAADEYAMRSAVAAEWQSYWAAWAVAASATSSL